MTEQEARLLQVGDIVYYQEQKQQIAKINSTGIASPHFYFESQVKVHASGERTYHDATSYRLCNTNHFHQALRAKGLVK